MSLSSKSDSGVGEAALAVLSDRANSVPVLSKDSDDPAVICPTCGHRLWRHEGADQGPPQVLRSGVDLRRVLGAHDSVIDEAVRALPRLPLPHYELQGPEAFRDRLHVLYRLVIDCLDQETLEPMSRHGEAIAEERFSAGFEIAEVLTAFNLMEDTMWQVAVSHLPPEDHAEARGRIAKVLAAGKDAAARAWVSVASRRSGQSNHLLAPVVESVGYMHPAVPKDVLEEIAKEVLATTEDARVKAHRLPLAQNEVNQKAVAWERTHLAKSN